MRICFKNAYILSMDNNTDVQQGDVWVKDDKIEYVGKSKQSSEPFDREIDATNHLVMPGFKNAHTHSAMTFLRSYADDLPLLDWLEKQVFPMEGKLTQDDMVPLVQLAVMEYLTSGITACFDMYMFPHKTVETMMDIGYRTVLCGAVSGDPVNAERLERDYLLYRDANPLLSYRLGFHAEYTSSKELMQEIAKLSKKYKEPVYTHTSESKPEVAGCIERYGKTPTALMNELGLLDYGGGGFHCVYFTEEDMDIFAQKNGYVISNPGSNAKLASGIAPLSRMKEKGIQIGLGTDGPASNNALDFFREMYLATVLQKVQLNDASAMPAGDVLEMATVGSAHAMGLMDCDILAEGKQADLIMIDLNQPNMQPLNNIAKNIVYSGSKQDVVLTMVAGKVLYEDGSFFIGAEPQEVYRKSNEIITRMTKS